MAEPLYPLLSISRLRVGTDGAGVTSLVGGAGCPLNCRWCINKRMLREAKPEFVEASELISRLMVDDLYFRATGGGVCFGGGESLLHADFIRRFRALCPGDWKITAETSLSVSREQVEASLGAVDRYVVDCKDFDPEIYRRYTGGDERLMEGNLRFLLEKAGAEKILVRVPLIPEYNSPADQQRSADALRAMGVKEIECFSYVIREE